MIRLSRMADYAVLSMTYMAARPTITHNAVDVAHATGLPVPTVAKLLAKLARGGVLSSQSGARGGYALDRHPRDISMADVIIAIDGTIALTHCVKSGPTLCEVEAACPSRGGLQRVNKVLNDALSAVSLDELVGPAVTFPAPRQLETKQELRP